MAIKTLAQGIQNSCNYYFYCIGTGIDWNTKNKTSLGYKITIDDIMKVASEFGLGEKTGIELYETTTPLASKERKMSGMEERSVESSLLQQHQILAEVDL